MPQGASGYGTCFSKLVSHKFSQTIIPMARRRKKKKKTILFHPFSVFRIFSRDLWKF